MQDNVDDRHNYSRRIGYGITAAATVSCIDDRRGDHGNDNGVPSSEANKRISEKNGTMDTAEAEIQYGDDGKINVGQHIWWRKRYEMMKMVADEDGRGDMGG